MTVEAMPLSVESVEGRPDAEEPRRRRKAVLLLLLVGLLAMLGTIAIWYLIYRQPITQQIPLIPVSQVPTYSTSIYGATQPSGVAVTAAGDRIYVIQSSGDRTGLVFDASGKKIGLMAPPPSTGTSHAPVYAAVDPLNGEVYVSDRMAGAIYVYDRDGAYQREFALAAPRPGWQPLGLAFDKDGLLYVTDLSGPYQKVLVIDRSARVIRTIGEREKLNFPNGVFVDGAGDVFVTDSNDGRLLEFNASGGIRAQVGRGTGQGNLGLPRGLSEDGSGRLFVTDTTGQGISIYRAPAADGQRFEYVGFVGGQGVADGQFQYPNSVAVDARGRVYVADTFNDRVQIWSY
jgi:tripartite motif-containing protein 71